MALSGNSSQLCHAVNSCQVILVTGLPSGPNTFFSLLPYFVDELYKLLFLGCRACCALLGVVFVVVVAVVCMRLHVLVLVLQVNLFCALVACVVVGDVCWFALLVEGDVHTPLGHGFHRRFGFTAFIDHKFDVAIGQKGFELCAVWQAFYAHSGAAATSAHVRPPPCTVRCNRLRAAAHPFPQRVCQSR